MDQDPSNQELRTSAGELETATVETICRVCRQQFQATRYSLLGITLTANVCSACSERMERKEAEELEASKQRLIQHRIRAREEAWQSFCPKEFRLTTEGGNTDIVRLEREQPRLQELLRWAGPRGLIVRGKTGKCKTRCVWRLVRKLYVEGKRIDILTAGQFDRQCRDAAGRFTLTEWFQRLATLDLFILDDLGKGEWTGATEATWFDLIDERTRENRPIIVTTNDTGASLEERMTAERGEALIRRLRDYCDAIIF